VLSVSHMERLRGGLLYAASSHIPWATLLSDNCISPSHCLA